MSVIPVIVVMCSKTLAFSNLTDIESRVWISSVFCAHVCQFVKLEKTQVLFFVATVAWTPKYNFDGEKDEIHSISS